MSRKRSTFRNSRFGFTLIEIMLALLVIMIGIVAISGLLGTSLGSSAKSHDDLNVVGFADMVLNYYHSETNWNDVPPSVAEALTIPDYNDSTVTLQLDTPAQFTCRLPGFGNTEQDAYTVTYLLHAEQAGARVKELTLQVWSGYATNSRPRTFYTEIYNWANQ
jgi:Tfp pilus assembly protein PilV